MKLKHFLIIGVCLIFTIALGGYIIKAYALEQEKKEEETVSTEVLDQAVSLNNDIQAEIEKILEAQRLEEERLKAEREKEVKNFQSFIKASKSHRFVNYDIRTKTNLKGYQLEKILAGTGLEGLGNAYAKAEQDYGVSAIALIGISGVESAWGTSNFSRTRNNIFGFQAYDSNLNATRYFNSKADCILHVANYLSKHYLSANGKYHNGYTLRSVNKRYASDKQWNVKITEVMNRVVNDLN